MTDYLQLITPTPDIPAKEGMCLQYVRQSYNLPIRYGYALEAWTNSPSQHTGQDFPAGCWAPLWFEVAGIPWGHVVNRAPDGTIWSTSDLDPDPVHHHPSLQDLLDYYARYGKPLTYLGWTEDVAGYPVITPLPEGTPTMANLDLSDRQFIQQVMNENGDRIILDNRAQIAALGATLAAHLNMDPATLAQALLNAGTVTITPKQ